MKVGILTFHDAHNYGAVLQAYALRTFLRRNGYEASIVNYKNKKISSSYPKTLSYKYHMRDFIHVRSMPKMIRSLMDTNFAQKSWGIQWEKFRKFIYNVILENDDKYISLEDFKKLDFDAYIAGSDQIWNGWLTGGLDAAYFLDFKTTAKKIFYGASNGQGNVPENEKDYYYSCLRNADAIATREQELADTLSILCGRHVSQVLDPTLLIDAEDYVELTKIEIPENEEYLFAYFVVEDKRMMVIAEFLARVLKLKLVELHYYQLRRLKSHHQYADFGPEEFLQYIKNAKFVITNSFHGTVFSIIFQKQFYSVYDQDSRKQTLLEKLGLEDRHVSVAGDIDLNKQIDYFTVRNKLEMARESSTEYLLSALKGKGE